ncbi:hypothetical protein V6N13_142527 [Hibiscus sabdariffa]
MGEASNANVGDIIVQLQDNMDLTNLVNTPVECEDQFSVVQFVNQGDLSAAKTTVELVESDDSYGYRLLLMEKDLQDGVWEAISIQTLNQRSEIQLGLDIESQKAILSMKRRMTCELLIYCSQAYLCLYGNALSHGYGKKYSWFIKWKFVETKTDAYYLMSLINFFDDRRERANSVVKTIVGMRKRQLKQKDIINGKVNEVTRMNMGGNDGSTKLLPCEDEFGNIDSSKESILQILSGQTQGSTPNLYDVVPVLLALVSLGVRETLLPSEKQFQTMERLFERLVAKKTLLEGEKKRKKGEHMRLVALLDNKETQFWVMNEQSKIMTLIAFLDCKSYLKKVEIRFNEVVRGES